jgi:hypothetical protein
MHCQGNLTLVLGCAIENQHEGERESDSPSVVSEIER